MDRTSWCNKVDAVRLYASHRFALILPRGRFAWVFVFPLLKRQHFQSIRAHAEYLTVYSIILNIIWHAVTLDFSYIGTQYFHGTFVIFKENRIYIRGEFKESLGMNFFSPFPPEREFKVYKSCKCSQIICSRVHLYSMIPILSISSSIFLTVK